MTNEDSKKDPFALCVLLCTQIIRYLTFNIDLDLPCALGYIQSKSGGAVQRRIVACVAVWECYSMVRVWAVGNPI